MPEVNDFSAIRITLASPQQIRGWSYGEVTKPETINYRTLKPEKDGLFCERIFGPVKDFECYCGKYKKMRYKGVICDRCGVEVTRAQVRRERMGHIALAAPVSHIWFVRGTPSRLGLLLDLSPRNLERVIYFSHYIITKVNDAARDDLLARLGEEVETKKALLEEGAEETAEAASETSEQQVQGEEADSAALQDELESLKPLQLLTETKYKELKEKCPGVFEAAMGAGAILTILEGWKLEELRGQLLDETHSSSGQRRKKAIKRLRVAEAFRKSGNKPEWMTLTVLPVLPPDLRPMVQLDGGRFATSDLNDLYRRVINRNNRLKRLLELGAPEIIIRNEKRMLQEAVDSLIDNGRRGRPITGRRNHKLKSLSDMLRGKQGRFRQNLLGKRVDYSGRAVIVVGPELKLHQCGLPKKMALELFKPFVVYKLVLKGLAHNVKNAKRMVDRVRPEVWDILEEVIKDRPVLLNRAPTLHRLGIQAFLPILVEGNAVQVHPLVCAAFNADFDGDQMAVHVPLSRAAVAEAKQVMLSTYNMLSPASGEPLVAPTLDIVLGCYYLTDVKPGARGEGKVFTSWEAKLAYDLGFLDLQAQIKVRLDGETMTTTVGRLLFNEALPKELGFRNHIMDKKALKELATECYRKLGAEGTAKVLDQVKHLGFSFATRSGITIALGDIEVPPAKSQLLQEAEGAIAGIEQQYQRGLLDAREKYESTVRVWQETTDKLTEVIQKRLPSYGGIYLMAASGAKGNIAQIKQMAGMRGLMSDPSGRIIDLPIRSSFREGLSVLEYFISTHGARKGLADTALRTADSGYLTRRLVDVSQEVIILGEDCGTRSGIWVSYSPEKSLLGTFAEHILGRVAAAPIVHPRTGEVLVERDQEIDEEKVKLIEEAGIHRAYVRSPLSCESRRGLCRLCYGRNPAKGKMVGMGEAAGIFAAQSIGEPGTQLTMRTFHTGGIAGMDITSGLPRVEELFEARSPKGAAVLAEIDGRVEIITEGEERRLKIVNEVTYSEEYALPSGYKRKVSPGERVEAGAVLATPPSSKGKTTALATPIVAPLSGRVSVKKGHLYIDYEEREEREYLIPATAHLLVENGAEVKAGQQLSEGPMNPQDLLSVVGKEAVQQYIREEVQKVYRSHGVVINNKHIEVIIRQMLSKVRVDSPGDTDLLPGELVDRFHYEDINAKTLAEGGEPATAQTVLLGVTKASLNTDSFLAAASFQETTRVLTEAAINGSKDPLLGLKENVIIGRLIPARAPIEIPPAEEKPVFPETPLPQDFLPEEAPGE